MHIAEWRGWRKRKTADANTHAHELIRQLKLGPEFDGLDGCTSTQGRLGMENG